MIEFKGELTGACKKFLLREQSKGQTIASLIAVGLFSVPTAWISIRWNPLVALFFIPYAMLILFSILPPGKSAQKIFMPKRVFIDLEEQTIVHECEKMERFHMLDSVKQVIDYGDWYYFKFNYEDRDPYFVCQKSLLTQGTLEEFEALFTDKIVRM